MESRTLYECMNARVKGDIYCCNGHKFASGIKDGSISVKRLARGEPLIIRECQRCLDYDCAGAPLDKTERGWIKTDKSIAKYLTPSRL